MKLPALLVCLSVFGIATAQNTNPLWSITTAEDVPDSILSEEFVAEYLDYLEYVYDGRFYDTVFYVHFDYRWYTDSEQSSRLTAEIPADAGGPQIVTFGATAPEFVVREADSSARLDTSLRLSLEARPENAELIRLTGYSWTGGRASYTLDQEGIRYFVESFDFGLYPNYGFVAMPTTRITTPVTERPSILAKPIEVFPNPVGRRMTVRGDFGSGSTFTVIGAAGSVISANRLPVVGRSQNAVRLDVSGLPDGLYFLQVDPKRPGVAPSSSPIVVAQ